MIGQSREQTGLRHGRFCADGQSPLELPLAFAQRQIDSDDKITNWKETAWGRTTPWGAILLQRRRD
jgi:hypothetical protein